MKLITIPALILAISCNENRNEKSSNATTDLTPRNLHVDRINNFKITYPPTWKQIKPTSSQTVFKIGNVDSMLSLSVNIQDKDESLENLPLTDDKIAEKTKVQTSAHIAMGTKLIQIRILNYKIGTRPVLTTIWHEAIRIADNNNIIYVHNDFEFNFGNRRYSISLKGPLKYLDENRSMYYIQKYVESFQLLDNSSKSISQKRTEKTDNSELTIKHDEILSVIGIWEAEADSRMVGGLKYNSSEFTIDLRNDATGKMDVSIVAYEPTSYTIKLSFDISKWGIVSEQNNTDKSMFFMTITNGKLIQSTIEDKKLEEIIYTRYLKVIQDTGGLAANLHFLGDGVIEFTNLNPNEFYPTILRRP